MAAVEERDETLGGIWSMLSGVGRIRSGRDWITCACLLTIVCSMPITNMPALNFQLVSLNSANTAAPVPVSRVAGRFLQFPRVTSNLSSLAISFPLSLCFPLSSAQTTVKQETVPLLLPRVRRSCLPRILPRNRFNRLRVSHTFFTASRSICSNSSPVPLETSSIRALID